MLSPVSLDTQSRNASTVWPSISKTGAISWVHDQAGSYGVIAAGAHIAVGIDRKRDALGDLVLLVIAGQRHQSFTDLDVERVVLEPHLELGADVGRGAECGPHLDPGISIVSGIDVDRAEFEGERRLGIQPELGVGVEAQRPLIGQFDCGPASRPGPDQRSARNLRVRVLGREEAHIRAGGRHFQSAVDQRHDDGLMASVPVCLDEGMGDRSWR